MVDIADNKLLRLSFYAYIFLLPLGMPLFSKLVAADLPAFFCVIICVVMFFCGKVPAFTRSDAFFGLFVGISLFGLSITAFPGKYLMEISSVAYLYFFMRLTGALLNKEERLSHGLMLLNRAFLIVISVNFVAITIRFFGISDIFNSFFVGELKLSWPFEFSGQLGVALSVLLPVCICSQQYRFFSRLAVYILFIASVGSTGSRSAFAVGIFEILVLEGILFASANSVKNWLKNLGLLLVGVSTIMLMTADYGFQRSLGWVEDMPLIYDAPRLVNFRAALISANDWIWGHGFGCFEVTNGLEIHSTPLSILVETGVFGVIAAALFLWLVVSSLAASQYCLKNLMLVNGLRLAVLSVILQSFVRNFVTNRLCWLLLSLCYCLHRFVRRKVPDNRPSGSKTDDSPEELRLILL